MSPRQIRNQTAVLRVDQLEAHPGNVRQVVGNVTELAASIREHGILEPLVVTPLGGDLYRILAGHRRAAAARLAGHDRVPCIVRTFGDVDDAEEIVVMLVENVMRADLGPVEKAQALGRLRDKGLTNTDIARRTGMHVSTVTYHLQLLDLDIDSLEKVRAGEIPVGAAREAVVASRQQARTSAGRPERGRPPVAATAPYFGPSHSLALSVSGICDHTTRPRVPGGIGCGECWELAIRADAAGEPLPMVAIDEVAVARAVHGERVTLSRAERYEAVRRLAERGETPGAIAARLRISGQHVRAHLRALGLEVPA